MDSPPCSGLSSVASSAPFAHRRTWTQCLDLDKSYHDKEVIDDLIRFFLANDLKKSGHSVEMEGRCLSKQWGGYLQREVHREFCVCAFAKVGASFFFVPQVREGYPREGSSTYLVCGCRLTEANCQTRMKVVETRVTVNLYRWGIHNVAIPSCSLQSVSRHVSHVCICPGKKYVPEKGPNAHAMQEAECLDGLLGLVSSDVEQDENGGGRRRSSAL